LAQVMCQEECQVGASNVSSKASRIRGGPYKITGRNINIAPLPNLAVSESHNINDIVFLIDVALVKR